LTFQGVHRRNFESCAASTRKGVPSRTRREVRRAAPQSPKWHVAGIAARTSSQMRLDRWPRINSLRHAHADDRCFGMRADFRVQRHRCIVTQQNLMRNNTLWLVLQFRSSDETPLWREGIEKPPGSRRLASGDDNRIVTLQKGQTLGRPNNAPRVSGDQAIRGSIEIIVLEQSLEGSAEMGGVGRVRNAGSFYEGLLFG
jgi:hypothetical protein